MLLDDELSGCTTIDDVEIGLIELKVLRDGIRKLWAGQSSDW
ncbi:hypothetical protein [Halobellus captivus]|nr:hypothetical protein [Halobellus captivus]